MVYWKQPLTLTFLPRLSETRRFLLTDVKPPPNCPVLVTRETRLPEKRAFLWHNATPKAAHSSTRHSRKQSAGREWKEQKTERRGGQSRRRHLQLSVHSLPVYGSGRTPLPAPLL